MIALQWFWLNFTERTLSPYGAAFNASRQKYLCCFYPKVKPGFLDFNGSIARKYSAFHRQEKNSKRNQVASVTSSEFSPIENVAPIRSGIRVHPSGLCLASNDRQMTDPGLKMTRCHKKSTSRPYHHVTKDTKDSDFCLSALPSFSHGFYLHGQNIAVLVPTGIFFLYQVRRQNQRKDRQPMGHENQDCFKSVPLCSIRQWKVFSH